MDRVAGGLPDDGASRGDPRRLPSPFGAHPLDDLASPRRATLFRQVLARRCGSLAVVVEDCHDPHNATAVCRTCDCLGIHRVEVVTGRNDFKINRRVSQGAHEHLDLRHHAGIGAAYAALRAEGFAIAVSHLDQQGQALTPGGLRRFWPAGRLALVFGSEHDGVSAEAVEGADATFRIPMVGFSQSLNLSISVAITLWALRGEDLSADRPGDLPSGDQERWYGQWLLRQFPAATPLLRQGTDRNGEDLAILPAARPADPGRPGR